MLTPQVTLLEHTLPGSAILSVSATDRDSGANGHISYHLASPAEGFSVDPNNGASFPGSDPLSLTVGHILTSFLQFLARALNSWISKPGRMFFLLYLYFKACPGCMSRSCSLNPGGHPIISQHTGYSLESDFCGHFLGPEGLLPLLTHSLC